MPLDDPDKNLFDKMRAACRLLATTVRHTTRHYLNTPMTWNTTKKHENRISIASTTTAQLLPGHCYLITSRKSWKTGDRSRWKAERQGHIISKLCSASDYGKQPVTPALCNSTIKIPHISFSSHVHSLVKPSLIVVVFVFLVARLLGVLCLMELYAVINVT